MKATIILGTRAELIKTYPVIQQLEKQGHELKIISTGQHKLEETCQMLGINKPDYILTETVDKSSKFNGNKTQAIIWNIKLLFKIKKIIQQNSPDYVIYHGDTMSTTSAAIASSRLINPLKKYKTVHIEAGLRSGSLREPFPEEISRIISDLLANILFAPSTVAEKNLSKYKLLGKKVFNVGNTIVDSLQIVEEKPSNSKYAVATVHRHENISSKDRMAKIVEILEQSPYPVKFHIHDNTKNKLKEYNLIERLEQNDNILLENLQDYPEFLATLKNSSLIYTDGGSIQEESLEFKVPCVILRKKTERKEGLKTDLNLLSELNLSKTTNFTDCLDQINREVKNPYGSKGVSQKIVEQLEKLN